MTISATLEGDTLVIRVPVGAAVVEAAPLSKAGRSKMVFKTDEMLKVDGTPYRYSLMVIAPLSKLEPAVEKL